MIRGTTVQFKLKLPYEKDELGWVTIKFWQNGNHSNLLPITKKLEHCDTPEDPKCLCVSLTSEETARFSDKYKAIVQFRALHKESGIVFGSRPQIVPVYPMRDDIIEEDPILPVEDEDGWVILDGDPVNN